jgi:hypothetical protein
MSDWIRILRAHCARSSQVRVAEQIGYSSTVVNQVLKGTYPGNWEKVRASVEGALMGATVDCPVIGEIPRNRCIDHQNRRQFAATNPLRVRLHRACRTCEHNLGGDK